MKYFSLLLSLSYNLQSGVFSQDLVGSYQSISIASNKCVTKDSLVLKDTYFVRSFCGEAPEYKSIMKFGKWIKNGGGFITALFADSTTPPHNIVIESKTTLRDGNSNLEKVEVTPINKVAEIFGNWKAADPQPDNFCEVAKSLEIDSNGQIRRYSCRNGHRNWFEKGFFTLDNLQGNKVTLLVNFNGSYVPLTLQVSENNRELLLDNQVFLFRQQQ